MIGQIIPDKNEIVVSYSKAVDLNMITKVLAEISNILLDAPMFLTHLIHRQGLSIASSRNREESRALALGGRQSMTAANNQPDNWWKR